jgi:hypothetical protein
MQEGIPGPSGKLYKAESLVGIVPLDGGADWRAGSRFKALRAGRSRRRSEIARRRFEVVVVETTATGWTKASFSAAHVVSWRRGTVLNLKYKRTMVNGSMIRKRRPILL